MVHVDLTRCGCRLAGRVASGHRAGGGGNWNYWAKIVGGVAVDAAKSKMAGSHEGPAITTLGAIIHPGYDLVGIAALILRVVAGVADLACGPKLEDGCNLLVSRQMVILQRQNRNARLSIRADRHVVMFNHGQIDIFKVHFNAFLQSIVTGRLDRRLPWNGL